MGQKDHGISLKAGMLQSRLAPPSYSVVCYQIMSNSQKNTDNQTTSRLRSKINSASCMEVVKDGHYCSGIKFITRYSDTERLRPGM